MKLTFGILKEKKIEETSKPLNLFIFIEHFSLSVVDKNNFYEIFQIKIL
jgi:hypothetical protein